MCCVMYVGCWMLCVVYWVVVVVGCVSFVVGVLCNVWYVLHVIRCGMCIGYGVTCVV